MKKFAIWIAAMIVPATFYAAPVGNTSAPSLIQKGFFTSCTSRMSSRAGYEGDFVADGRMEQYNQGHGRVDCYEQNTNSATATFNMMNRLDIYGIFGSSKAEATWRFKDVEAETITRICMHTKHNFLWATGARAILYEWYKISLGIGGSYSSCHYRLLSLTSNGAPEPTSSAHCFYKEWQVHLDMSYKIDLFTPYIGTKYSHARTILNHCSVPISQSLTGSNRFKNRVPVGLYLGCSLSTGEYFMLNVEGRLVDEEAITVSADFRF